MAIYKCKMCGGDLNIENGISVAECDYCGTKQTVPTASDEGVQALFNRANTLRTKCEFDKAEKLYEKIIQTDETQCEAYWGLILCKYGIEYVEDPKTFNRIPTCHRTSYDSIIADDDYKSALEFADSLQRAVYEAEAKKIDRIQKEILELSKNEELYDVFICYKETDSSGQRTPDSVIANDIYYQLTEQGFKVFYAAITLEDKLGSAYEPCIFAALNSAMVMLSIGTKPEYFNAVWVKNEWSRFLKIIEKDRTKALIPCYRDMDAYELPEEFAHLQAQDMSKIGFINDLIRGIKKLVDVQSQSTTVVKETVISGGNANTAPLLKRAFMFLEDGDWDSADEYCEKVLDIDPECAEAYLGKLMVELKVKKQDNLKNQGLPFDDRNNFQKAMRFADEKLKTALVGYIDHINTRNENTRLDSIYTSAKNAMSAANTESAYKEAATLFESIGEYQDAATLVQLCYEKAETARKDAVLSEGKSKMTGEIISNYESSIKLFESISGWKDADEQIIACQKRIEEIEAKEKAERLEKERQVEIERKEAERIAKRNKKIAIVTTPIVCVTIAFIIVLNAVIIPNSKYNKAISFMGAGNIDEAYSVFMELGDYKDAVDKANNIRLTKTKEQLKSIKVGDYIIFGTYEQDNNSSNETEDIEWLVLDVKDGKALLISKYALDCKQYNTSYTDVTWENSTLREWLNNDFIKAAFSADERAMIPTVTVSADKNPKYSTNPGNTTQDQLFLLSINDVGKYFNSDGEKQSKPTNYAVANGVYVNSANKNCWWWLRSPGAIQNYAAYVNTDGDVIESGDRVYYVVNAVRPALWISLE